jgi:hypothetical protein
MGMTRAFCLGLLGLLTTATMASTPAAAQQQQKPNILFIMGDDIGWKAEHLSSRSHGRRNAQY